MKWNLIIACLSVLTGCSRAITDLPVVKCGEQSAQQAFAQAAELSAVINELVKSGIPGCAISVTAPEGSWSYSAGYAKIEDKTPMESCHLQYLQSVSKTYLAVAVLKLNEQGKINLDDPITRYLDKKISGAVMDADKITVRMLMNHTSGIPEYNSQPAYVSYLLQHPDYVFQPVEYLRYIKGKPLDFAPGTKYSYRNTNYLLLALIADAITGDHAKYIDENISKPLGLVNTFYRNDKGYLNYPRLVNGYWDRHSDGILENASVLQRNNVAGMIGDDGIVTTPAEAVMFLKGLMEGKLIGQASLDQMMAWVKDKNGNPTYGLGLDYAGMAGHTAYGHSGGGLGAGCQLYYFPDKQIYCFVAVNLGTVTDSPIHEKVSGAIDQLYAVLMK